MYKFFNGGKNYKNIQLKDNDIISVPTRKSWVKLENQVIKPKAIYESIEDESIDDLIQYASGITNQSSSKILISHDS